MIRPFLRASVLVCTYNRADLLREMLESLRTVQSPRAWDVVVVDNNSSDHTRAVVENFARVFPVPLTYVFEARQGKSYALNTGIQVSGADIIVFTDDDVRVGPGWLDAACSTLDEQMHVDYTGGPVRPIWGGTPPVWLDQRRGDLWGTLAILDYGDTPFVFEERRRVPLGANMAVRRTLIERIGGFHPALGPARLFPARPGAGRVLRARARQRRAGRLCAGHGTAPPRAARAHDEAVLPAMVVLEGRIARARGRHAPADRAWARSARSSLRRSRSPLHLGSAAAWGSELDRRCGPPQAGERRASPDAVRVCARIRARLLEARRKTTTCGCLASPAGIGFRFEVKPFPVCGGRSANSFSFCGAIFCAGTVARLGWLLDRLTEND